LFNRFNLGRSASTEHLEGTATSTKTIARTSLTVKSTEKEPILPLHTSPSMPNFIRSSSSLLPNSDDDRHQGMVAIDIPDYIELDGLPKISAAADIEHGGLDHPPNESKTNKKNDSSNDEDEGIIV
jgi:hypothetical protein